MLKAFCQDLARIRAFYADKTRLRPALAGKIRLRDGTSMRLCGGEDCGEGAEAAAR